jgi:predicted phage terminase large subunit-like protein
MDDLQTRRKPTTWEVGINTRWHEDDVSGRILPETYDGESGWIQCKDGNDWYVICLPAECDREDDPLKRKIGDILWPEWFTEKHLAPFKRQPRTWSALFQQKPAPDTGVFFDAKWLKPYTKDQLPKRENLTIYGASDYAVTEGAKGGGGDYTVHIVVGMDPQQRLYVLDLYRAKTTSDAWIEKFCDLVQEHRPLGWAEESGQINAGVGPFIEKRLRQRRLYIARAQYPSRAIKQIRAQAIRGWMSMNGLYVPTYAPWYPAFHKELMSFPAGRSDDQVDALSLIGQVLDMMVQGKNSAPPPAPPKVLSTDPKQCTVTLTDMFEANERRYKRGNLRIH